MNKNSLLTYILVFAGAAAALFLMVYGALMPMIKAQRYINGLRNIPNVKSVDEFKTLFDAALNFPAPVGDEEVVKYLSNDILGIIQRNQPEEVDRELVAYIEPRLHRNNVRHLLSAAQMHTVLLSKYRKEEDYKIAESYYVQALQIGPKLPPLLYGLYELYIGVGNKDGAKEVAKMILANWPEDERIKNFLETVE